ncbi:MAG: transposase, partial [Bacteroidetes bacterium]
DLAHEYQVNLYGRNRTILAYDQIFMLKTLKRSVRVVWIYRKTRWVALFTTDLTLSIVEIIQYYGARWKIDIDHYQDLYKDYLSYLSSFFRPPYAFSYNKIKHKIMMPDLFFLSLEKCLCA